MPPPDEPRTPDNGPPARPSALAGGADARRPPPSALTLTAGPPSAGWDDLPFRDDLKRPAADAPPGPPDTHPDRTPMPDGGRTVTVPGYDVMEELGRGGMGVVYKARHLRLHRLVALKMVLGAAGDGRADERTLVRFLAEAEAVAAVQHRNVVQVYEYGQDDGRPYMALEFVPGGSLADLLKEKGRLAPGDAAAVVGQIAWGVQAAHAAGIVHRDLKPGNVLLGAESGTAERPALSLATVSVNALTNTFHHVTRGPGLGVVPKVTDFGLAKRLAGLNITRTGAVMGTPGYMAPEQTCGTKFVGPQADVWALGVILYELLTGRRPFDGDSINATLAHVLTADPLSPRQIAPDVPRDLELVCLKCLEKEPADRYESAAALADDLHALLVGDPISIRPAGLVERAVKWTRRRPWVAGLAAALVASLVAGTVVSVGLAVDARDEAERARANERRANEYADEAAARDFAARIALARFATAEGQRCGETGDWRTALLWFAEAVARLPDGDSPADRARYAKVLGPAQAAKLEAARHDQRVRYATYRRYADGQRTDFALEHKDAVMAAAFSEDGKFAVTGSRDKTARVWDLAARRPAGGPIAHAAGVMSVAFSPDGRWVATAAQDGTARVWDARTGRPRTPPMAHAKPVESVAFSKDGAKVLTASQDGTARVWDAATGAAVGEPMRHAKPLVAAVFSPDGRRVATASRDNTARVWDAASGRPVTPPLEHPAAVEAVAFSPDGAWVATGRQAASRGNPPADARVWDAATGALVRALPHDEAVFGVSFGPDGSRLATACGDFAARVFDRATGQRLVPPMRHTSTVFVAWFCRTGGWVLTTGHDDTARVWDARTGQAVTPPLRHEPGAAVFGGAFAPDRSKVLTVSGSAAWVWDLVPDARPAAELVPEARRVSGKRVDEVGELLGVGDLPVDPSPPAKGELIPDDPPELFPRPAVVPPPTAEVAPPPRDVAGDSAG